MYIWFMDWKTQYGKGLISFQVDIQVLTQLLSRSQQDFLVYIDKIITNSYEKAKN